MIPKFEFFIALLKNSSTFASGKSYTTSSHELPQGRKAARVSGCSGAIYSAYPFFISVQEDYQMKMGVEL